MELRKKKIDLKNRLQVKNISTFESDGTA